MKKNTFLLLAIFCVFVLLGGIYWRAKTWQTNLEQLVSSKNNFNFPEKTSMDSLFNQGEIIPKEFVSPDGKLKIDYSSDWQESQKSELESLSQSVLLENAKFIFFARKINIEEASLAFLMIQEIEREGKDLSEIIEKTKESQKEIEIIESEIGEKEAFLEVRYDEGESSFQSKERLILSDQKVYLIGLFSQERDWQKFEEETEKILASARVVE